MPVSKSEFIYDYASRKAVSREYSWTKGANGMWQWNQTGEKRRVFDGLDVVQERNAANEVTAQLVRDGNIGGILSRSTATGASFYDYDGGGNVTLLTDENGNDVGRYRYDAFGNTLEATGARAGENPYRFSTKEYDGAAGLYDFGYRFYSPGMGRWINRDPIRERGGTNLYGMVGNNPTNSVDFYGLDGIAIDVPKGGFKDSGTHVRIAVTGPNGKTYSWYGFYPDDDSDGSSGSSKGGNGKGVVRIPDNPARRYREDDYTLWLPVTPDQAKRIRKNIINSAGKPPDYDLQGYNCSNWAADMILPELGRDEDASGVNTPKKFYDVLKDLGGQPIPVPQPKR